MAKGNNSQRNDKKKKKAPAPKPTNKPATWPTTPKK